MQTIFLIHMMFANNQTILQNAKKKKKSLVNEHNHSLGRSSWSIFLASLTFVCNSVLRDVLGRFSEMKIARMTYPSTRKTKAGHQIRFQA